ncbi:Rne/Rng family ribonuclease [Alloscardovia criceti]|uniref:Rne/Rng family ribonuclease n=1 Tax=Alloscardovia criceti TaxID=356828 RepID=UPI000376995E|nr:Rne/Rng family ribonuclease [Alloscardovia criceti]
MSNRINPEPPVLGRRTNQNSRRVVRVTGAKDSQVTELPTQIKRDQHNDMSASMQDANNSQTGTQPVDSAHQQSESVKREIAEAASQGETTRRRRRTTRSQADNAQDERTARTHVRNPRSAQSSTQAPEQSSSEQSASVQLTDDQNHAETERGAKNSRQPRSRASYTRSAQAERIAAELFVDTGIEVPEEAETETQSQQTEAETPQRQHQSAQDHSAQRLRARNANSRENSTRDTQEDSARGRRYENRRESRNEQKDSEQRNNADQHNAENSNHETIEDNSQQQRSHRARAAVSQMLEFSSSDTTRETPHYAENFGAQSRPMMSLLFQAPVIPEASNANETSDEATAEDSKRRNRRNRKDRTQNSDILDNISHALDKTERSRHADDDNADDGAEDFDNSSRKNSDARRNKDEYAEKSSRHERRRNRKNRGENERNDNAHRDHVTEPEESSDEFASESKSRRSRRLNAQERRAAAEVELIENDLEFDDIAYEPIESDEDAEDYAAQSQDDKQDRRSRNARNTNFKDDEAEEEFTTRRRRRRRGSKNAEDDNTQSSHNASEETRVRSRKQQYIDEITDVEGSTRLEAKRQRRRDNRRDRNRQAALITEQDFLARREVVNRIMVVRERGKHTQVSVIEDDVLVEHYISDIADVSAVGNIYQGRVQNVLPSMEAAFVDIGQARNGVLYAGEVNWDTTRLDGQPRRMEHAFKSGDPVLVQVTKDPIGHKGARLTSQVTLAGRFLVLVPSGGMTGVSRKLPERERARLKSIVSKIAPQEVGVIIRTAAEGASEEAIIKDFEHIKNQWEHISSRLEELKNSKKPHLLQGEPDVVIRVIRDIFNDDFKKLIVEGEGVYNRIHEYIESAAPDLLDRVERWDPEEHRGKDVFDRWQIDSQLRKGMERQVYLPSGGSLVIDRTEAMTTIDVNTGRFIGKGKSLEETVTRCNLEAAEEVVRQLRLRDIGGMVMIDFVDMVMPANRDLVLRRLVECLSRDRTKHQVAEVTSLGLVQMTRKRVGQGLVEAFSEECPTCAGRGFILHDEPTVSAKYDDPYAMKGGDPFVKTNKHTHASKNYEDNSSREERQGTTEEVKNSMAAIAAAGAGMANTSNEEE